MDRLLEVTARAERVHFWFRGLRWFAEPLIAEASKKSPNPVILDCGCGTGHNLSMLRRHGRAIGIDLTWTGLAFAHARGERAVAQASATRLPFPEAAFDVVTSFDVIYSFSDEEADAATREMFRVLRPGGHLVINAAALPVLKGNHSVLAHEVTRHTRTTLTKLLHRTGFELRRMTYTNAAILPAVLAVRLAQRAVGLQPTEDEISVPPAPVNAALSAALAVEALALRWVNMPIGSSLMALAEKPSDRQVG
ncbi:MAG: class I SAM-dependent methyltransferase [Acidobacteria bacterium]|nr:class I SAM-dependent methyltransferase [Acidobacteriota bacterium]MCA1649735.1 class I SAM-dependent methyltransferase [Acidobacteriota bacterium]